VRAAACNDAAQTRDRAARQVAGKLPCLQRTVARCAAHGMTTSDEAINRAQYNLFAVGAQAIGMALHELATDAGKYGALSNATGTIEITWGLDQAASPIHLKLGRSGRTARDSTRAVRVRNDHY
jgi:two-component sensor histidine kinase